MNTNIELYNAPPYTDMNTNMNVNIELHNAHGRRASGAKRGERGTPAYADMNTNRKYPTLSVRVFCWENSSLRPGRSVHCIYGFLLPPNPVKTLLKHLVKNLAKDLGSLVAARG